MSSFSIQFQGGFASKEAHIEIHTVNNGDCKTTYEQPFYAEDINAVQHFKLNESQTNVKRIKLIFESSTDFFGRIIVYNLKFF